MAAVNPRASGLYSDMAYTRLSTHDPSSDLDDPEMNEIDSRTPLDRTIDQIGMGTHNLSFFPPKRSVSDVCARLAVAFPT
jgi:hypothetical protein